MKHDIHVAVLIVGCGRFDCRMARQRGRLHVGQGVLMHLQLPSRGRSLFGSGQLPGGLGRGKNGGAGFT